MTVVPAGTVVGYVKAPWRSNPVPVTTVRAVHGLVDNGTRVTFRVDIRRPGGRTVGKGERLGTLSTSDVLGVSSTPLVAGAAGSGPTLAWRLTRL
jgi:hypothetical protein